MIVKSLFHRYLIDIHDFWKKKKKMVMSFTIKYCDIELEDYWQIPVNKLWKYAQGMLGVLNVITKLTLPILLINKLILRGSP